LHKTLASAAQELFVHLSAHVSWLQISASNEEHIDNAIELGVSSRLNSSQFEGWVEEVRPVNSIRRSIIDEHFDNSIEPVIVESVAVVLFGVGILTRAVFVKSCFNRRAVSAADMAHGSFVSSVLNVVSGGHD
jgi:hypothetical protein